MEFWTTEAKTKSRTMETERKFERECSGYKRTDKKTEIWTQLKITWAIEEININQTGGSMCAECRVIEIHEYNKNTPKTENKIQEDT